MELIKTNLEVWLTVSCALAILLSLSLAASIRSRRRTRRELLTLTEEHKQLKVTFNDFIDESEKVTTELARMVKTERAAPVVSDVPRHKNGIDKKYHVLRLSKKGASIDEIAEKLMMPQGEIQLILDLYRDVTLGVVRVN